MKVKGNSTGEAKVQCNEAEKRFKNKTAMKQSRLRKEENVLLSVETEKRSAKQCSKRWAHSGDYNKREKQKTNSTIPNSTEERTRLNKDKRYQIAAKQRLTQFETKQRQTDTRTCCLNAETQGGHIEQPANQHRMKY